MTRREQLLAAIADRLEAGELLSEKSMSDADFLAPLLVAHELERDAATGLELGELA